MKQEKNSPHNLIPTEGVLCWGSLIFLEKKVLQSQDKLAKKTLEDLYKYVSFN